jgi:hypothetical protein
MRIYIRPDSQMPCTLLPSLFAAINEWLHHAVSNCCICCETVILDEKWSLAISCLSRQDGDDLENSFLASCCGYILPLCVATFSAMKFHRARGREEDGEPPGCHEVWMICLRVTAELYHWLSVAPSMDRAPLLWPVLACILWGCQYIAFFYDNTSFHILSIFLLIREVRC